MIVIGKNLEHFV